jgi:hypothetical protein
MLLDQQVCCLTRVIKKKVLSSLLLGVARAFSNYLDSLIDNRIQNFFQKNLPIHVQDLSPYPDLYSFTKVTFPFFKLNLF